MSNQIIPGLTFEEVSDDVVINIEEKPKAKEKPVKPKKNNRMKSLKFKLVDLQTDNIKDHIDFNCKVHARLIRDYIIDALSTNLVELQRNHTHFTQEQLRDHIDEVIPVFMKYLVGIILRDHKLIYEISGNHTVRISNGRIEVAISSKLEYNEHKTIYASSDIITI